MTEQFDFDAAISFLTTDLGIARDIHSRLEPGLKVFIFTRNQETVAVTDGMDSFRTVFRNQARLSIVLFRQRWGNTPWTGVEEVAIKERCLQTKYKSLVIVNLDSSKTPGWVPDTYVHFDLQRYSLEELVGVVKARAEEVGATIHHQTSNADRAAAIERHRAFDTQTVELLGNSAIEWDGACNALMDAVRAEAASVMERTGWKIDCGPGALIGGFIASGKGQTIQLIGVDRYANTARRAYLELREYDAAWPVYEHGRMYFALEGVHIKRTTRIDIRRVPKLGWCWQTTRGREKPTAQMAEEILGVLLNRIEVSDPW